MKCNVCNKTVIPQNLESYIVEYIQTKKIHCCSNECAEDLVINTMKLKPWDIKSVKRL